MDGQIPDGVKHARYERLYAVQEKIMLEKTAGKIGNVVDVLYEGIDFDRQMFVGRTRCDAPDVDSKILFTSGYPLDIGTLCKVAVTDCEDDVLLGETGE